VFIPFLYDKTPVLFGKLLCFIEILYFESLRFSQLHFSLDIENCLCSCFAHMDMNRAMVIAVKCKSKTIFFKNQWHFD